MTPYYSENGITIYHGDCRETMQGIADNSIDAIVTDPPYALTSVSRNGSPRTNNPETPYGRTRLGADRGFMGKTWDTGKIVHDPDFWMDMLRFAKPGAHLLAFGGSRTFHRLACAIEDAGWEIRDTIFYCYGSGFPKSKNIGCRCKDAKDSQSTTERDVRSVRDADVPQAESPLKEQEEAMQSGLSESDLQGNGSAWSESEIARHEQSGMEGRLHLQTEQGELHRAEVCTVSASLQVHGSQGRLCDGASVDDGSIDAAVPTQNGSGPPSGPQHAKQHPRKPRILPNQRRTQTDGRGICQTCGGLLDWIGFGTALKPAHEPIMVARKPLDGTVAENVQRWGVGALDIDGCRIDGDENTVRKSGKNGLYYGADDRKGMLRGSNQGRWPANLIHDGSEEVVGLFPEAPGQLADASLNADARKTQTVYGAMRRGRAGEPSATSQNNGEVGFSMRPGARRVDCGSAARFFYTAKASGEDRGNEEWEALPLFSEEAKSIRNPHPTVKPLALMRYLIKLVTREGHLILDPFMGSGSTLVAAKQISRKAIGCELEREYIETAERRLGRITGHE